MDNTIDDKGRQPIIRCECGHTLAFHARDDGFGTCVHPAECGCSGWTWDEVASDIEHVPIHGTGKEGHV